MKKRRNIIIVIIAGLPILLSVYNPSLDLGVVGLVLGFWGMFISPMVIFGFLFYCLVSKS